MLVLAGIAMAMAGTGIDHAGDPGNVSGTYSARSQ